METRRTMEGELRPGSVVWLHRAGRLLRTAPEQLRKASPYEVEVEELTQPIDIPWTMTALLPTKCRNYVDLTGDLPSEEQWQEAHERSTSDEAVPEEVKRRRIVGKGGEAGQQRKRQSEEVPQEREVRRCSEGGASSSRDRGVEREAALEAFYAEEDHCRVVEIHIEVPTSKRGMARFLNNAEAYVCSQMRRKQVEVQERRLKPEELKKFCGAKEKEVRNYVSAECFALANKQCPDEKMVLGMRWLLTWKYDEQCEGGKKAKARAIILGYQDPRYSERPTAAPTPTKAGRQLFFQLCAWKKFRLAKGDISGAFLQGEELQEEIWCRPLDEIAKAMGVAPGTPMLMKKAAYGLVQAPLHWHNSVNKYLKSQGYIQLQTEPCCWIWVDVDGEVKSAVHAHVDDFLFAGKRNCPIHHHLMENVQAAFKWGTWEFEKFTQCGIEVSQQEDGSIELMQSHFIGELEEIKLSRDRSRQEGEATTESEKSQLRGVLGSLSWIVGQTCFLYSVDVNFMITKIPTSTIEDILQTNKIVRDVKKLQNQKYLVHAFPEADSLEMIAWTDAAWANRPNNVDSTEGIFIGLTDQKLRQGLQSRVTPIHWRSGKIERVCRSPATAETMASLDGEDDLTYLRFLWAEMQGFAVKPRQLDKGAKLVKAMMVTDAKNLYDKLNRATVSVKGAEKRATIEAISLRQNLERTNTDLRWVDGGGMIANILTKTQEKGQGWLFLQLNFEWRITYDERYMSQKKRRAAGLSPLESQEHTNTHP